MDWLLTIFRAIAEAIVGFFERRLARRDAHKQTQALERMIHASDLIQRVAVGDEEIQRLLLLRATNGGGAIRMGAPLYVEVYMSSHLPGVPDVEGWDLRRRVDTHYMKMLSEVQADGWAELKADRLPKSSMLHGVYEKDGVPRSTAIYVGFARRSFYFLSVNHTDDARLSAATRERLGACVTALRNDLGAEDDPTNDGRALRVATTLDAPPRRMSNHIRFPLSDGGTSRGTACPTG